jgi:hypothetical protein
MNKAVHLFARLTKIDEAKREVYGVATAEMVDKEGEIFDYATSKPYFKAWSDEISKATDGKSLGNVREMHEPSAVGKLIDMNFDDELKQIDIVAKIIDDRAWQKCAEGVYTGFSIGGQYVKAWKDGDYTRFTANPAEISVVDNPCVPGAHFTAVKTDGNIEVRKFAAAPVLWKEVIPEQKELPLTKDLGTVANLAYILQSVCYIQCDAAYEAEFEGDGSSMPDRLKSWARDGATILAAMTQEELDELMSSMKAVTDKLGKAGAKHSAETKAHHAAIAKCMGKIYKAAAEGMPHCDALMGKGDMEEAVTVEVTKQVPAVTEPKIETQESNIMEANEKVLLEKAAADSASSLSKFADVEKQVTELKTAQEAQAKGQEEIVKTLSNITKILGKMAGVDEGTQAQKVVRNAGAALVTKEQDNGGTVTDVSKMSQHDQFKNALDPANVQVIEKMPGRLTAAR